MEITLLFMRKPEQKLLGVRYAGLTTNRTTVEDMRSASGALHLVQSPFLVKEVAMTRQDWTRRDLTGLDATR